MKKRYALKGFLLIEALVSVAVFALMAMSIIPVINFMFKQSVRSKYEQEASLLAQQVIEISYNLFTADWTAFPNGTYKPALLYTGPGSNDYQWTLEVGSDVDLMTRYKREITIENVCRDQTSGVVVTDGNCTYPNTTDTHSRLVKTKVVWNEGGQERSVETSLLLANI